MWNGLYYSTVYNLVQRFLTTIVVQIMNLPLKLFRTDVFQQDSNAAVNNNSSNNVIGSCEKGGGGGSTGGARSSQVSLSSNPDLDFRYSAIFIEVAFYRGRLLAVKRVRRQHIDINREIKKELKIVRTYL